MKYAKWVRYVVISAVCVAGAGAAEDAGRTFAFEYRAAVGEVAGDAKIWIPVPQDTDHPTITELTVETKADYSYVTDADYGNQFLLIEWDGSEIEVSIRFVAHRVRRTAESGDSFEPLGAAERARYLSASRMVVTDGVVAAEAQRIAGNADTAHSKARSLYDHIVSTVRYDKSGEGWGRGDAVYACDTRAGNCTDFHSLFIGEARSLGVPSRFLMGFSIPRDEPSGEIGGYHCWGEYYDDAIGWVPLDASEAFKAPARRDELFGGLDADRVQFTVGRDIVLPGMSGEPLNFAIYPYLEVDGQPNTNVAYSFRYRDVAE